MEFIFEEVVCGVIKEICILILEECDVCYGSGVKSGIQLQICLICYGFGQVQMCQGFFVVQQICLYCQGCGMLIKDLCNKCYGYGCVECSKMLFVKILVGVDIGDCICFVGEGEVGEYGVLVGDLYVQVQVKQYLIFECEGNNLYCEVLINFVMVVLGGEIEVLIFDGCVKLKVSGEIQIGKLFCMCGKGVKFVCGGVQGDLLCCVVVEILVGLNERQKQLL